MNENELDRVMIIDGKPSPTALEVVAHPDDYPPAMYDRARDVITHRRHECARFGGYRPGGLVRCWNVERTAYMDVRRSDCGCAYRVPVVNSKTTEV